MINNFYSSISNGNIVEKCSHKQHHVPELPYLLRNNFLSEFRTAIDKAKVRAQLGIADSETLKWGNIQGAIEDQTDIAKYINGLLSFDYDVEKGFDAGDHFQNIQTVRQAAITCLDYLSKFKGEGEELEATNIRINEIINNLYGVNSLEEITDSTTGVINTITEDIKSLKESLGNPDSTVEEIEEKLGDLEGTVDKINESLTDINSLLVKYVPTDGTNNALEIIEDTIEEIEGELITHKGGLYVKDLQPQIDALNKEIAGISDDLSILSGEVEGNTQAIGNNAGAINTLNNSTIPGINSEIDSIKQNYISKSDLGSTSPIITQDKLTEALKKYVEVDSTASLAGITSKQDAINIDKPFNMTSDEPLDPRRYVKTKEDLLKIQKVWKGMEVIVTDNSIMYICTDPEKSTLDTYEAWKPSDSLRIEVLTWEEFQEKKENNLLDDSIYYYIYLDDVEYIEMPNIEDYIKGIEIEVLPDGTKIYKDVYDQEAYNNSLELYSKALEEYKASADILSRQYLSAAWGEDMNTRVRYKADKAELDKVSARLKDIEDFFGTGAADDSVGSLSGIKELIASIFKPEEVDPSTGEIINPATGLLVDAQGKIVDLEKRVQTLEKEKDNYVTWDSIGEDNAIVTETKLKEELDKYVLTDSDASLKSITSKEDTIKIDKPLEITTNKPLDERHYVDVLSDLYKIPADTAYKGMEVIVKQDSLIYMLDDPEKITSESGWKVIGATSIVNLTLEEFNLRKENTNTDGSSKGQKYKDGPFEGLEIPTLQEGTYYFIEEGDINVPTEPNKQDFMNLEGKLDAEKYAAALEEWRKGTYYLLQQYMSASWGVDMEALIATKASSTELSSTVTRIAADEAKIEELQSAIDLLESYFEESEGGTIKGITDRIDEVDSALKVVYDAVTNTGLLVDTNDRIQIIENQLYGTEDAKSVFVSWEDLGADNSDREELQDGKTLFVKTSVYEQDKADAANHFETKELTLTGDTPATIIPLSDRIAVNNEPIALKDELLKKLEFDSYADYFNWISDESNEGYAKWAEDKDPDLWYFLIKNVDGKVLPSKLEGESEEDYQKRLDLYKDSMYLTAKTAEDLYETKAHSSSEIQNLQVQITDNDSDILNLQNEIARHDKDFVDTTADYTNKFSEVYAKLQELWASYYHPETNVFDNLETITSTMLTSLEKTLKDYTDEEVVKAGVNKVDYDVLDEIWDSYIQNSSIDEEDGTQTVVKSYTPLKDIIAEIFGSEESSEDLSLSSLKAAIDLRETIADHNADIDTIRGEISDALLGAKDYTDTQTALAKSEAIEACLNAVPIKYWDLVALRNSGELAPGRNYRIIDYKTTTKEPDTKVIWHPFDLVVTALSESVLSEVAYATLHAFEENPDTYYDNCNLSAWELRYCLDNDATRYSWVNNNYTVLEIINDANGTYDAGVTIAPGTYNELGTLDKAKCQQIGTGVIYYMKDEFGNECAYDFKSIVFKRFYIENPLVNVNNTDWIINKYYSAVSKSIASYETIITPYKARNEAIGEDSRFYYTFDTGETQSIYNPETGNTELIPTDLTHKNANENKNTCRDNHFAYPCNLYNVIKIGGNEIVLDLNRLTLSNNVFIGDTFISNSCFELGFAYNTILSNAKYNTFGSNFAFNIIANTLTNNSFGNDCRLNIIDNNFSYNTVGNWFYRNYINQNVTNNTFGEHFENNSLSYQTIENYFGDSIKTSKFPDYFQSNEVQGDTQELEINATVHYMRFCTFNKGITLFTITDTKSRSNLNTWYQYINFNHSSFRGKTLDLSGEYKGPEDDYNITPGNTYILEIQNDRINNGINYIWCPADIVKNMIGLNTAIETLTKKCLDLTDELTYQLNLLAAEMQYSDSLYGIINNLAGFHNITINVTRPTVTRN